MLKQVKQQENNVADLIYMSPIAHGFPDFPAREIPRFSDDWEDTSYGNDLCPSYALKGTMTLQLFFNRERPEDRYDGPESPRFNLQYDSDDADIPVDIYVGESFEEAMEFAAAFVKGMNK